MLTENEIIDKLDEYFTNQRCKVIKKYTHQQGIDMEITGPGGQITFIEVKGETSSKKGTNRWGKAFSGSQIKTHVGVALLKTIADMSNPAWKNVRFAMAFPDNHEPMVERIGAAISKLDIEVYLVSKNEVRLFNKN